MKLLRLCEGWITTPAAGQAAVIAIAHRGKLTGSTAVEPPWRASVIDSLLQVGKDAAPEQFTACIESALFSKTLSRAGLPILFSLVPRRLASLENLLDFGSESGLESIARTRLAPVVRHIATQVEIPGIARGGGRGRVDLLIDGWLVIELDGDEFHDPVADRGRNATLVRLGYRIHRFGYDQVIKGWSPHLGPRNLLRPEPTGKEFLRSEPDRTGSR